MLSGYRNDLYFVIERGDFERGGKSSSKNVEVTVLVLDEFGRPIQVKNLYPKRVTLLGCCDKMILTGRKHWIARTKTPPGFNAGRVDGMQWHDTPLFVRFFFPTHPYDN